MDAVFKKVIEEKIANGSHMALELKKAKESLVDSIKKYKETYDNFKKIEKPNFEQTMEEADSWGKLFERLLYYDEIKMYMRFRSDIEIMLNKVKQKLEMEKNND